MTYSQLIQFLMMNANAIYLLYNNCAYPSRVRYVVFVLFRVVIRVDSDVFFITAGHTWSIFKASFGSFSTFCGIKKVAARRKRKEGEGEREGKRFFLHIGSSGVFIVNAIGHDVTLHNRAQHPSSTPPPKQ